MNILVDTGSTVTLFPLALLADLGLKSADLTWTDEAGKPLGVFWRGTPFPRGTANVILQLRDDAGDKLAWLANVSFSRAPLEYVLLGDEGGLEFLDALFRRRQEIAVGKKSSSSSPTTIFNLSSGRLRNSPLFRHRQSKHFQLGGTQFHRFSGLERDPTQKAIGQHDLFSLEPIADLGQIAAKVKQRFAVGCVNQPVSRPRSAGPRWTAFILWLCQRLAGLHGALCRTARRILPDLCRHGEFPLQDQISPALGIIARRHPHIAANRTRGHSGDLKARCRPSR
ncbi:MAG TPA: hypothetical protein VMP01_29875 [Pirellulaceae bacterium]|nr:hypothetical protein [Pirellulaceae bacterium]